MSPEEPGELPFLLAVRAGAEVAAILAAFDNQLARGIPVVLVADLGATHLVLNRMRGSGRSSYGVAL